MAKVIMKAKFGAADISIETGRIAKQANSVVMTQGDTVVLVTCVGNASGRPGTSFLPLTCDFIEKKYAAGKIPGGYFKREGRPGTHEILKARMMDRPMRPLFPSHWRAEIQLIATVLSFDGVNDPTPLAITGASAATHISDVPFDGPIAGARVVLVDGEYVVNPTIEQQGRAELDLIVAAGADAVTMVEGRANEVSEAQIIDAIDAAHKAIKPICKLQDRLRKKVGREKMASVPPAFDVNLYHRVIDASVDGLEEALLVHDKMERKVAIKKATKAAIAELVAGDESLADRVGEMKEMAGKVSKALIRGAIIEEGRRLGGRGLRDIRAIDCEVGILPRTHGSALFTRGETQAIATITLGTRRDEQRIDDLLGDRFEPFMLHYNFPPFCVGEARFLRGTSRREIGHGTLAWRGVKPILPPHEDFSYTLRIVSEVTESNGSSSMATVCAASLALMQAGVPVKKDVAGIAMGLIKEDGEIAILSDILGDEDHVGDMDFKVVGTDDGITAIQMDIKIDGLSRKIMEDALEQAREGRLHILGEMRKTIAVANEDLTEHSPRIVTTYVKPDKIRDIIGPGGKMIRGITEQTGCQIDVDDTGKVTVASPNTEAARRALEIIEGLTEEPEVGRVYFGTVRKILEFGAFVEILPGTDGLVHISELADHRVERVEDILSEGDEIYVKCIGVDRQGKIRLSRKEALGEENLPEV